MHSSVAASAAAVRVREFEKVLQMGIGGPKKFEAWGYPHLPRYLFSPRPYHFRQGSIGGCDANDV